MKNLKKAMLAATSVVTVLALSACGDSAGNNAGTNDNITTTDKSTVTSADTGDEATTTGENGSAAGSMADSPLATADVCDFASDEQISGIVGQSGAEPQSETFPDEGQTGCSWRIGHDSLTTGDRLFFIHRFVPPIDVDEQWETMSSSSSTSVLEEPSIPGADEALVVRDGMQNVASVRVLAGDVILYLTLPDNDSDRDEPYTAEERVEAAQPIVSLAGQILSEYT